MAMHINADICTGCGTCLEACPSGPLRLADGKAAIDEAEAAYVEGRIVDRPDRLH
jgi:ferredoxin